MQLKKLLFLVIGINEGVNLHTLLCHKSSRSEIVLFDSKILVLHGCLNVMLLVASTMLKTEIFYVHLSFEIRYNTCALLLYSQKSSRIVGKMCWETTCVIWNGLMFYYSLLTFNIFNYLRNSYSLRIYIN